MKFKTVFLLIFLTSCVSNVQNNTKSFTPYNSKGFALVYEENDFDNKIISKKLDNNKLEVGHRKLGKNKILILTNPENNKSVELKVSKKIKYPNFFNVVITKKVSEELGLSSEFPFLEVHQRVKNKSFVAKKAEMFNEEKNVFDKAPVTKIKIDNISKIKNKKNKKQITGKKFSILIGEFYSKESANNLKNNLVDKYIKTELLKVRKLGKNRFELSAGPYFSINTLKSDYFTLNKYGFEDLDIKQND
tara:strand:- start:3887 stop:4627 length:741 start_codon:yes stop_codon:yes gene_type:complete